MNTFNKTHTIFFQIFIFCVSPLLILALGDFPQRDFLKEMLSILTILSFFLILGQFFLIRSNVTLITIFKWKKVLSLHKLLGYIFIPILLLHPFFIIVPRFFESGILPFDAFIKMITAFNNIHIVMGITAWIVMIFLGLTSYFRNYLGISYQTWKILHGALSIAFIIFAAWHAIGLGRHMTQTMAIFITIVTLGGSVFYIKSFFTTSLSKEETYA